MPTTKPGIDWDAVREGAKRTAAKLDELRAAREEARAEYRAAYAAYDAARSANPNGYEDAGLRKRLDDSKAAYMRAAKAVRALDPREKEPKEPTEPAVTFQVTREARTYRPDGPNSFFTDLRAAAEGSSEAAERLHRSQLELGESRDVDYTAGAGFLPPEWVASAWASLPRQPNVLAEAFTKIPMSATGQKGYVPKVTASGSIAAQADDGNVSDNTALASDTAISELATFAGKLDLDRRVAERVPGADLPLALDLVQAAYAALDSEQLNGPGSAQRLKGLLAAAGTNAASYTGSPSGDSFLVALYEAAAAHYAVRKARPDFVVMHSRRWNWFASSSSSTFPLIAQGDAGRPSVAGMAVLIDDNIPTNFGAGTDQDRVVLLTGGDVYHAESVIRFRYDQVQSGQLGIRYECAAYAYLWAERRPEGITVLDGTGLVAPSGF